MEEKLNIIKQRFIELSDLIIQPDIISDQKQYVKISKEYKDLKEIVDKINEYNTVKENIEEAEEILKSESDKEMIELASSELSSNKDLINEIEELPNSLILYPSSLQYFISFRVILRIPCMDKLSKLGIFP